MSEISEIKSTLPAFTTAIQQRKQLNVDEKGNWKFDNWFIRVIRIIFNIFEDRCIAKVIGAFNRSLDELEKIPVKFNAGGTIAPKQQELFDAYIKAAGELQKRYRFKSAKCVMNQLDVLAQRVVALQYRRELENGGLNPSPATETEVAFLEHLAAQWKQKQEIYQDKQLNSIEKQQLKKVAAYGKFIQVIIFNPYLRNEFFNWALRDCNNVQAFIEFPATCSSQIKKNFLSGRLGLQKQEILTIKKKEIDGVFEKHMRLPFDAPWHKKGVKRVSILSGKELVKVAGKTDKTTAQILRQFSKKNDQSTNWEVIGGKIIRWNTFKWTRWNEEKQAYVPIDLSTPDWWKALPVIINVTRTELEKRYNFKIAPGEWMIAGKGTRTRTKIMDIGDTHGYKEVGVPQPDGTYNLYPFGKFPKVLPRNMKETLSILTDTTAADIEYPDANVTYAQRQAGIAPKAVSAEAGMAELESIRKDALRARNGHLIFQFGGEGCAHWAQDSLEQVHGKEAKGGQIPNYFKTHITNFDSSSIIGYAFRMVRRLPEKWQPGFVKAFQFVMGSTRSHKFQDEQGNWVVKSLNKSSFYKKLEFYHPSSLHKQILEGKLQGRVEGGHSWWKSIAAEDTAELDVKLEPVKPKTVATPVVFKNLDDLTPKLDYSTTALKPQIMAKLPVEYTQEQKEKVTVLYQDFLEHFAEFLLNCHGKPLDHYQFGKDNKKYSEQIGSLKDELFFYWSHWSTHPEHMYKTLHEWLHRDSSSDPILKDKPFIRNDEYETGKVKMPMWDDGLMFFQYLTNDLKGKKIPSPIPLIESPSH